jgi:GDP/UDP-N,N'-diacetylbacillosamine 2-epimerase (hydrolysing)
MKRKICVVTGSRADYGLLRWVIQGIKDDPELILQIVVTGMHLSSDFGLTYKEIEADGFNIDSKVDGHFSDDSPIEIVYSLSAIMAGCASSFDALHPDIVVVLGDRFEIFAAATSAFVERIPIAHLHGGEKTVGALDEGFRHSITKMSHFHFVAAADYGKRVIQLGESPENVFQVGGLGVDNINRLNLLTREELETKLQVRFDQKSLLITFHPVTLEDRTEVHQMTELLKALSKLKNTSLIFTSPNSDTGGRGLIKLIEKFVSQNKNASYFASLGQLLYLSCIVQVDAVIGNSSSGLTEVPSFKKGTINIGDRQRGRLMATSVINCEPEAGSILSALNKLYSINFQMTLPNTVNPYGEGGASERVVNILRTLPLDGVIKKTFHDL